MKWIFIFITSLALTACNNQPTKKQSVAANNDKTHTIQHSEKELTSMLDSIGQLNPTSWNDTLLYVVDSVLNGQTTLNHKINSSDFNKLKSAAKKGEIEVDFARTIFPELELDSSILAYSDNNKLTIGFYSFDKDENEFNEFAISIDQDDGYFRKNDVYFFKGNKIIAKHNIYHSHGLILKHFRNENNETIIYYTVNYGTGTGIWWYQYNFYCYDKDKLVPALTEIKNAVIDPPWGIRGLSITATLLKTDPLQFKFVYENTFADSLGYPIDFLYDSTEVKYNFDNQKKIYIPDFTNSKLTRSKLLTYFLDNNELLFASTHYELLKNGLNGENLVKRQAILNYLDELKNRLDTE